VTLLEQAFGDEMSETYGETRVPVTEAQLREAGKLLEGLTRELPASDYTQDLLDLADWLYGVHGDPGSAWPLRAPMPSDEVVQAFSDGWRKGAESTAARLGLITTRQGRR